MMRVTLLRLTQYIERANPLPASFLFGPPGLLFNPKRQPLLLSLLSRRFYMPS